MKLQRYYCDVLICGAGPLGLWTAAQLQEKGYSAVIVDANPLGSCQAIHSEGFIHQGFLAPPMLHEKYKEAWQDWNSWFARQASSANAPPHLRRTEHVFADWGSWSSEITTNWKMLIPEISVPTEMSPRTFDVDSRLFSPGIPEHLVTSSAFSINKNQYPVQFAAVTTELATEPEWLLVRLIEPVRQSVYASTRIVSIAKELHSAGVNFVVELQPPDSPSFLFETQAVVGAAGRGNFDLCRMYDPAGERKSLPESAIQAYKWGYILVVESYASTGTLLPFTNINYGAMRDGLFVVSRRGMSCPQNVKWLISNEEAWVSNDNLKKKREPKTARQWLEGLRTDLALIQPLAPDKPYRYGLYVGSKVDPRLSRDMPDDELERVGLRRVDSEPELLSVAGDPFWLGYPFRLSLVPRIAAKVVGEIEARKITKGPVICLPTSRDDSPPDLRPACAAVTMHPWKSIFDVGCPLEEWCNRLPWE